MLFTHSNREKLADCLKMFPNDVYAFNKQANRPVVARAEVDGGWVKWVKGTKK